MFEWAKVLGIIPFNQFVGLKVMISKKVSEQRNALGIEDLQTLFDEKHFIQNDERPSRYWIPIIAAYSGMRMEEIAQLTRSDLQVIEGVLCFNINDDGDKKLKTLNSARIVPVHSELLRLGFKRIFEGREESERLFPDLSKTNGKWSHNFSKWFIRTVENVASLNRVKPSTRLGTLLQPFGKGRRCMNQFLQLYSVIVREESPIHDTAKGMRSTS